MKVIGFADRSFTAKATGTLIEGMYIFVSFEDKRTTGLACDRLFLSRQRLDESDYYPSLGDEIEPIYNRYGKINGIRLLVSASVYKKSK